MHMPVVFITGVTCGVYLSEQPNYHNHLVVLLVFDMCYNNTLLEEY